MSTQDLLESTKAILKSKRCVFHEFGTCEGKIISAHMVPKCLGLKEIAKDGYVYSYDLKPYINTEGRGMQKIGINQVSTFNFACEKHDNDLFKGIESGTFDLNNDSAKQFFLRSIGQEVYEIANQIDFLSSVNVDIVGMNEKKADLNYYLKIAGNPNLNIKYCCLQYQDALPILCTTAFSPFTSLSGDMLSDSLDLSSVAPVIVINVFILNGKSHVLFSWPEECNQECEAFVKDLLSSFKSTTDTLVGFLFVSAQQIILQPHFYEQLPASIKEALLRIYRDNLNPSNPYTIQDPKIEFGFDQYQYLFTNAERLSSFT